jgi:hypothetical protein
MRRPKRPKWLLPPSFIGDPNRCRTGATECSSSGNLAAQATVRKLLEQETVPVRVSSAGLECPASGDIGCCAARAAGVRAGGDAPPHVNWSGEQMPPSTSSPAASRPQA